MIAFVTFLLVVDLGSNIYPIDLYITGVSSFYIIFTGLYPLYLSIDHLLHLPIYLFTYSDIFEGRII